MARSYSDETKAVVMAALLTGQSVSSLAKEYEIPKGTVSGWKRKALKRAQQRGGRGASDPKKGDLGDRILDYLDASFESLKAQTQVFGDRAWLEKQEADQLAVLHGVQTDKAIRLLEAINRAESQN